MHGGGPPTLACGSHSSTSHRATYGQPDHGVNGTNDRANGERAIEWIRRRPIIVKGTDNRHYRVKGRDNGFMRCCDHRVSYRPGLLRPGVEAKVGGPRSRRCGRFYPFCNTSGWMDGPLRGFVRCADVDAFSMNKSDPKLGVFTWSCAACCSAETCRMTLADVTGALPPAGEHHTARTIAAPADCCAGRCSYTRDFRAEC